jgi:hypothetical protein
MEERTWSDPDNVSIQWIGEIAAYCLVHFGHRWLERDFGGQGVLMGMVTLLQQQCFGGWERSFRLRWCGCDSRNANSEWEFVGQRKCRLFRSEVIDNKK